MRLKVFWGMLIFLLIPHGSECKVNQNLFFKNAVIKTEKIYTSASFQPDSATVYPGKSQTYYVVQFDGVLASEFKRELQPLAEVMRYIPDQAFLIKLNKTVLDLERLPHVQWVGHYSSFLKVEQKLFELDRDQIVLVQVHLFSDDAAIYQVLAKLPIEILSTHSTLVKANVRAQDLSLLAAVEGVEWIEREKKVKLVQAEPTSDPVDPAPKKTFESFNGYASGAKVLNVEKLYKMNVRGSSEKIAIADSGLDRGSLVGMHSDLAGRIVSTYSLGRPENGKWDDPLGHGTHVAGLVAGDGTASQGQVRGVAYEAKLIIQSVFKWVVERGRVEKGGALPEMVSDLFEKPYEEGARIHTNSWQYEASSGEYDIQSALLDQFVWQHPDFVALFAAGNGGVDLNGDGLIDSGSISVPATAKNCIAVGASENLILRAGTQRSWGLMGMLPDGSHSVWGAPPVRDDLPSDNINGIAAFSSRGPTVDGRIKPDIVAPGTNDLSLRSRAYEVVPEDSWGVFNEDYVFMAGTSMATPLVAGAAALVREFYEKQENRSFISSALVKATLINGAKDLYPGQFANFQEIPNIRPNIHEGFGRVDLEKSLIPSSPRVRRSIDDTEGLKETEERIFTLKVTDENEPLRVTLVYSDFPSSPAVERALVNDLDLRMESSDGKSFYYPNGLVQPDDVNNVENIDIDHPKVGTYKVRIKASSIAMGAGAENRQPFAVVISGGFEL